MGSGPTQLLATHVCSPLLVPKPVDADLVTDLSVEEPLHLFAVGTFACSLVFRKSFELHPRLKPAAALRALQTALVRWHADRARGGKGAHESGRLTTAWWGTTLGAGPGAGLQGNVAVHNRPNMYVMASDKTVVYVQLSSKEPAALASAPPADAAASDDAPGAVPAIQTAVASPPVAPGRHAELVMEAFWLEPAGTDVTVAFVQLLEQKLAQQTLATLASALLRQTPVRLAQGDIDIFLSGREVRPGVARILPLPPVLASDGHALLASVRQHLLQVCEAKR